MLYDLGTLRKMSDNDELFIIDMLQTFKRTTPPVLERMNQYMAENKTEAVGREAHKMIPCVSFLGAAQLKEVLVKIEESAKAGTNLENMPAWVDEAISQSNELIRSFENDFPGKV